MSSFFGGIIVLQLYKRIFMFLGNTCFMCLRVKCYVCSLLSYGSVREKQCICAENKNASVENVNN